MSETIYAVQDRATSSTTVDFVQALHNSGLLEHFGFRQITAPVFYFRQEFLDFIAQHGQSAIYNFDFVMEDVTSPSLSVDETENVVAKFVERIDGAKRIMIIDPYLYAKSARPDIGDLFKRLLAKACSALEEIIFVTDGKRTDNQAAFHAAVEALVPGCTITDVGTSEFHDRFWIDPDAGTGLVMGTSLNGLGRKIALVDRLRDADAAEIVKLAKAAGAPL